MSPREREKIIRRFSPAEMAIFISIGGVLPVGCGALVMQAMRYSQDQALAQAAEAERKQIEREQWRQKMDQMASTKNFRQPQPYEMKGVA